MDTPKTKWHLWMLLDQQGDCADMAEGIPTLFRTKREALEFAGYNPCLRVVRCSLAVSAQQVKHE